MFLLLEKTKVISRGNVGFCVRKVVGGYENERFLLNCVDCWCVELTYLFYSVERVEI